MWNFYCVHVNYYNNVSRKLMDRRKRRRPRRLHAEMTIRDDDHKRDSMTRLEFSRGSFRFERTFRVSFFILFRFPVADFISNGQLAVLLKFHTLMKWKLLDIILRKRLSIILY